MEKSAKKRNLDVVMFEKYAIGTMDHASAITQMRAAQPDWIFATGYINDLILIRKQMKDLGVGAPVVTMIAGPAYKEFIDAVGPLAENISSAAWWHPAVRYDGKGVFGIDRELQQALECEDTRTSRTMRRPRPRPPARSSSSRSRTRARSIRQRCATRSPRSTPMTFFGRIKFGPTGQISSLDPPVFQLQGGKPVVIFPDYVKQAEFKFGVQ